MGATIPRQKTRHPGIYTRGRAYSVRYRDPLGRQRFRAAATLEEAKTLRVTLQADVMRGDLQEVARQTFRTYARDWIESYAGRSNRGIREATRAEYCAELEHYVIPVLGSRRLDEITLRDIKLLAASLSERYAPATVRNALAPVKALFATAVEEGVIRTNSTIGLRIARTTRKPEEHAKALTEEELARLIQALPEDDRLFIRFLVHTGLRISEAIGLQWRDLDLEARTLRVERRIYRGVDDPKSRHGRRVIPLSPAMARDLDLRKPQEAHGEAPVFTTRAGTPLGPRNYAKRTLKPACVAAGLVDSEGKPWPAFHALRHTCASRLFRSGLSLLQVSRWMGHHSPAFTMAVYVHYLPEDQPDASFLDALGI